jgi:hypothetical protein
MPEMPYACEDHRNAVAVAGGDDILVALAAACPYGSFPHSAIIPLLFNTDKKEGRMLRDVKGSKPTSSL